jgi:YrbI family 3-deoxy-D-manno-octulosonate 8-phosphate phosphatase
MKIEKSLLPRLKKIKMLATDVDGVLTDSGMYYSEQGDELKKFSTRDGMGLVLLRNAGYKLAIITSEDTKIVERRAS